MAAATGILKNTQKTNLHLKTSKDDKQTWFVFKLTKKETQTHFGFTNMGHEG